MSGSTKAFYATSEVLEIIKGFDKGMISKICNQALLEHNNEIIDLDILAKKVDSLIQEKEKINAQINYLTRRKKALEGQGETQKVIQKEALIREEKREKQQGIERERKILDSHIEIALREFDFPKEVALKVSKEYMGLPSQKRKGFTTFIESLGYTRKEKSKRFVGGKI
ncbi:MAG: hypothetical protein KKF50_02230 [Nanoarchaeota archaeon]|nr:hypothetical protein [Nanoarchaeota archaeon]